MGLYLCQIEPMIALADSIYDEPWSQRFDIVHTNQQFENHGANQNPQREDFTITTSDKQLRACANRCTEAAAGERARTAGSFRKVLMLSE